MTEVIMTDWLAQETQLEQGADFREIKVENTVPYRMSFTVSSENNYWRAGLKFCQLNDSHLPLLSNDSLLFHVGAQENSNKVYLTIYRNKKEIKNVILDFSSKEIIKIRYKITGNKFINFFINNHLVHKEEFEIPFHRLYLLAWGDYFNSSIRDYKVLFQKIKLIFKDKYSINRNKHFFDFKKIGMKKYLLNGAKIKNLLSKFWWIFCIPVVVYYFTTGNTPAIFKMFNGKDDIYSATSTINIKNVLAKTQKMDTSLERQNFLENYINSEIQGTGSIQDIGKSSDSFNLLIKDNGNLINCNFASSSEAEILLLSVGREIKYSGKFMNSKTIGNGAWYISDCKLLR